MTPKRTFDILFSSIALTVLAPILVGVATAILLSSKGTVIYRQKRLGKNRKPFNIYKFRTMVMDAEKSGPQLAVVNDARITKVGKFLRKYHIDEFTQFWNVLKGDMSVVGPRPEREIFVNEIEKILPEYSKVFEVKPGLTSLGMIKFGYASNVAQMVERAKFDLEYLENRNSGRDAKILLNTVPAIFKGKGL